MAEFKIGDKVIGPTKHLGLGIYTIVGIYNLSSPNSSTNTNHPHYVYAIKRIQAGESEYDERISELIREDLISPIDGRFIADGVVVWDIEYPQTPLIIKDCRHSEQDNTIIKRIADLLNKYGLEDANG